MSYLRTLAAGVWILVAVAAVAQDAPLSYVRDAVPVFTKAGCNMGACHGSFQGRGGMSLSLLGFNPNADYDVLFKQCRGRRVNAAAPEQSLLLLKATGSVPHGGGKRMAADSPLYRILRDYIAGGAQPPSENEPTVVKLEVTPAEVTLKPGEHVQLAVKAHWSDGVIQDATPWALYDSRFKQRVEVSEEGHIEALEPGKSPVTVRYLGQVAAVMVCVPFSAVADVAGFQPQSRIDELVLAEWQRLGLKPAPVCDDATYLRRVYLDLIGTLPTAEEVTKFLADTSANKRAAVVDTLLDRPEYVDYWGLRWGDLLRVHRRYLGEKGLASFQGWLKRSLRDNVPLDQLAQQLLTSQGSLYSSGPVAYYFIDNKPEELAETTSQVFLGVRLQCTRCHHHPLEVWSQDDYYGLAACFTRLEVKENGDGGRFGGARLLRPLAEPNSKRKVQVAAAPSVLGQKLDATSAGDIRRELAETLAAKSNPFFARNFANRYWAWLTGRGLVEPVDDQRATNPPSIPALLDYLAADFAEHDFDAQYLIRTICASQVYQLAAELSPEHDSDGSLYTHRVPKRMSAEVLLDAIDLVTAYNDSFEGVPRGTRAIALADPSVKSYFLDTFGRPARNSPCECARQTGPDLAQALHLANSTAVHDRIVIAGGRVSGLLKQNKPDAEIVELLYLAALGRNPTAAEQQEVAALVAESPSRKEAFEDLLWTLLNTSEFLFNH